MTKKDQFLLEKERAIEDALDQCGSFTHNMISSILRSVAAKYGSDEANKMIVLFDLEAAFGIHPVHETEERNFGDRRPG